MAEFDFDLITIGAGSGGVRASRVSADLGARVAIIEAGPLGGTCVNVGCIPKKLFSYAAHFGDDFEDARGFGWSGTAAHFDWPTLIANKDAEIARLNGVYRSVLERSGVTIVHGRAELVDAHSVAVADRRLSARHILIATGGRAMRPPIPGAELGMTSDEAFHLAQLPERVLVYGGGYIAVEFASIFHGLGVETTLVHRGERLLRGFDHELAERLAVEMTRRGVCILPGRRIERLEGTGELRVTLDDATRIDVDGVLFATGRIPNTLGLGLERVGVKLGSEGAIEVDAQYRTNLPSIRAIGDVIDRIQLTPVALAEGMVVADQLFGGGARAFAYRNIPTAVFSHPNLGSVGLGELEALAQGHTLTIFKSDFRALKHTLSGRAERTFMKVVVDAQTDRVLGMHMMGQDAGEVVQGLAVAMNCGLTKAQLDATIGIHPTLAEEFVTMRTPQD